MSNEERSQRITMGFNALVFGFIIADSLLSGLLYPESGTPRLRSFLAPLKGGWMTLGVLTYFTASLSIYFIAAAILGKFWNIFVTDVLSVRRITYSEALALSLVTGMLVW